MYGWEGDMVLFSFYDARHQWPKHEEQENILEEEIGRSAKGEGDWTNFGFHFFAGVPVPTGNVSVYQAAKKDRKPTDQSDVNPTLTSTQTSFPFNTLCPT